jgi:hypothetical protein
MCFGALPFEELNSAMNIHFIAAIQQNKKESISGFSLIPSIVYDLVTMENGILMYSAEENEMVLVVSPLLHIEGDTPCHNELVSILSPSSKYPCRKCYIRLCAKDLLRPV